nr:hypothetical protein [Providencia sp. M-27]
MTYLEEVFAGVERNKGKELADLFRSAEAQIARAEQGSTESEMHMTFVNKKVWRLQKHWSELVVCLERLLRSFVIVRHQLR